jgi:hypothetical protein
MNNKSIITVVLAIILALLCACLMMKKDEFNKPISDETISNISQQEQIQEDAVSEFKQEEIKASEDYNDNFLQPEKTLKEKPITNKTIINDSQSPVLEEKAVDNILKEVSIVEEVPDYGIMRDEDGNFVITRAFKAKSPDKYSFRGFGVIDKVSSK